MILKWKVNEEMHFKKHCKAIVVITSGHQWSYYEWFILGFYMLKDKGIVDLRFKLPLFSRMLFLPGTRFFHRVWNRLRYEFEEDTYNMTGYICFPDGSRKTFTIDSSDAPYMFNERLLQTVDVYFKMQFPKEIDASYYELAPGVSIPWIDSAHVMGGQTLTSRGERRQINIKPYVDKIRPLMIGPRRLSIGMDRTSLMNGYMQYIAARKDKKTKRIMCYFGNSLGPKPEKVTVPDYLWEGDVMGYFKDLISHPNEKRAIVADYIGADKCNDARVISNAHADSGEGKKEDLIIPLQDFCEHISNFQYNFNVSGYCKSIPNRFIESFMVGTGIITDKLSVEWYKPFAQEEVFETVEMGYLPMNDVDWGKFKADIVSLPEADPKRIIELFEEKWEPSIVARYILDSVENIDMKHTD